MSTFSPRVCQKRTQFCGTELPSKLHVNQQLIPTGFNSGRSTGFWGCCFGIFVCLYVYCTITYTCVVMCDSFTHTHACTHARTYACVHAYLEKEKKHTQVISARQMNDCLLSVLFPEPFCSSTRLTTSCYTKGSTQKGVFLDCSIPLFLLFYQQK